MDPDQACSTADVDREREHDYIQFFAELGIEDKQKDVFLAGLLRNYHVAAAKLDKHLVGYSAAVHAAVSRLSPAASVDDAPEHLWIRVHDRLGFFHDADRHAQRVVNVGMAFAYRHLELNAIAAANAQVLMDLGDKAKKPETLVEVIKVGAPAGQFVAPGGLVIGAPRLSQSDGNAQVGGGGHLVDGGTPGQGHGVSGGGHQLAVLDKVTAGVALDGKGGEIENNNGVKGSSRTVVINSEGACASPPSDGGAAVGDTLAKTTAGAPVNEASATADGSIITAGILSSNPPSAMLDSPVKIAAVKLLHDSQPLIKPSAQAVAAVKSGLSSIPDQGDIDDAVRELMLDSVLFFARNHSSRRKATSSTASRRMEAPAESWAALGVILEKWWARWEAPAGQRIMPPPGSTAYIRGSGRAVRQSRWCYVVDMKETNDVLRSIATQQSRTFKNGELRDVESVERIVEKDCLPLTRCVAVMLLLGTMDDAYAGALVQLGSTGRGEHSKNAHISSATCQAFVSSGLTVAPPAIAPSQARSAAASQHADCVALPPDVDSLFDGDGDPDEERYAVVARAREHHEAVVAKDNRAMRKEKRKRQATEPAGVPGCAASSKPVRPPLPGRAGRADVVAVPSAAADDLCATPRSSKLARPDDPQDGSIFHGLSWGLPSSPEPHPTSSGDTTAAEDFDCHGLAMQTPNELGYGFFPPPTD